MAILAKAFPEWTLNICVCSCAFAVVTIFTFSPSLLISNLSLLFPLFNYNLLPVVICFFSPLQLFDLLALTLPTLPSIPPPPGLYCTNCVVWRSSPDQIPTAMATIRHLEPNPGPLGIHPVSQISSSENKPTP